MQPSPDARARSTTPVAVLVSGSGSNMLALADAVDRGDLPVHLVAVVSDVPTAPALEYAAARGLTTISIPFDRTDRAAWERALADAVQASGARIVVLAGFMRILTRTFLSRWPDRVVNVHPSLLPAFRGASAVEDALAAGVRMTGVTIHLVDEEVDHGPILAQGCVEVLEDDTAQDLLTRLHEVEHRLLPQCVGWLAEGRVTIDEGRARIRTTST